MAELCAIVGESGSGKSTSLRNLNPSETFIINVANKPLPIKGYKQKYISLKQNGSSFEGNLYNTSNSEKIIQILKVINIKMQQFKQVII